MKPKLADIAYHRNVSTWYQIRSDSILIAVKWGEYDTAIFGTMALKSTLGAPAQLVVPLRWR